MSEAATVYFITPVLNEAPNLERLFAGYAALQRQIAARYRARFILVDDGSTDDTSSEAARLAGGLALEVLRHQINRGPGCAFATAFAHIAPNLQPNDWIVTLEGDNTSRLELFQQMLTRAGEGFDVVLASPYLYGGGIAHTTAYRVFLSHMANVFVKEGLGLHGIVTMSSFFRLYRGSAFLKLQRAFGPAVVERAGFESMIELLLKIVYLKLSVSEVAMKLDTSLRIGKSKMKVMHTSLGYVTLWRDKSRWRAVAEAALASAPAYRV